MFEPELLKFVEVGVLMLAGIGFGWWQLRDVQRAQAESARIKRIDSIQAAAQCAASHASSASSAADQPAHKP